MYETTYHSFIKYCLCLAVHGLQTSIDNDKFQVLLPNSNPSDTLQLVEWSTNLTDWESVARNFGSSWHNTFPNTETLTNVNGSTAHERDLTHPQVYYRLSSASSQVSLNNENSVARFLQQATFGPTVSTINQFPGINSNDLNDSPYSNYATWIQQQINLPITSLELFSESEVILDSQPILLLQKMEQVFMKWLTIHLRVLHSTIL